MVALAVITTLLVAAGSSSGQNRPCSDSFIFTGDNHGVSKIGLGQIYEPAIVGGVDLGEYRLIWLDSRDNVRPLTREGDKDVSSTYDTGSEIAESVAINLGAFRLSIKEGKDFFGIDLDRTKRPRFSTQGLNIKADVMPAYFVEPEPDSDGHIRIRDLILKMVHDGYFSIDDEDKWKLKLLKIDLSAPSELKRKLQDHNIASHDSYLYLIMNEDERHQLPRYISNADIRCEEKLIEPINVVYIEKIEGSASARVLAENAMNLLGFNNNEKRKGILIVSLGYEATWKTTLQVSDLKKHLNLLGDPNGESKGVARLIDNLEDLNKNLNVKQALRLHGYESENVVFHFFLSSRTIENAKIKKKEDSVRRALRSIKGLKESQAYVYYPHDYKPNDGTIIELFGFKSQAAY